MADESCVFCKIVKGEIPCFKIHENDGFIAFLDLAQFTEGHTIVVPKVHAENIWRVPDIGGYYQFIQELGQHFLEIGFKYVDTMTFGRMISHSHVHVIPHNNEDSDYREALLGIHELQLDPARHPSTEKGVEIMKKYSF